MVPVGGLPRAARTAGGSMPWSTALRMRCTSGSPSSSITALSTRVSSPCSTSSTCLPCWRARSRTSLGKRSKTWRMREHPHVHDRLLQLGRDAGHLVDRARAAPAPRRATTSATWRASSLSFVRWTISSPTRLSRWSSFAKSTRTMLERVGARAAASGALAGFAGSAVAAPAAATRAGTDAPPRRAERPRAAFSGERSRALAARGAGRLDGGAQRGRPLEQTVEGERVEHERPVAGPGEDLLEAVDVVLDPGEAHHPAVALEGVQRPEEGGRNLGVVALALEAEEGGVEDREVLPRVLEVDRRPARRRPRTPSAGAGRNAGLTAP